MVVGFAFGVAGLFANMFAAFLNGIGWSFPQWFVDSIKTAIQTLSILIPILPWVADFLLMLIVVVPAHVIKYSFRIALWLFSMIPFIGRVIGIPQHNYFSSARSEFITDGDGNERMVVTKTRSSTTSRNSWLFK